MYFSPRKLAILASPKATENIFLNDSILMARMAFNTFGCNAALEFHFGRPLQARVFLFVILPLNKSSFVIDLSFLDGLKLIANIFSQAFAL